MDACREAPTIQHIARERNADADHLANQAIVPGHDAEYGGARGNAHINDDDYDDDDIGNNYDDDDEEDEGVLAYGGNNYDDDSDDDNPDHQRGAWFKVSLFGRNIRAAMGSGSNCSVVSLEALAGHPYDASRANDYVLSSITGQPLDCLGMVVLEFSIDGVHFTHPFFVVLALLGPMLLGYNWMTAANIILRVCYECNQSCIEY